MHWCWIQILDGFHSMRPPNGDINIDAVNISDQ